MNYEHVWRSQGHSIKDGSRGRSFIINPITISAISLEIQVLTHIIIPSSCENNEYLIKQQIPDYSNKLSNRIIHMPG